MKKKISLMTVVIMIICTLSGCGKGIKADEAEAYVNSFFEAIEAEDYEKADSLLHPESPGSVSDLCMALEMGLGIDFQSGIEVKEYKTVSSALYDTSVKGSAYSLDVETTVSDMDMIISIQLVDNQSGYGIYSYNFTAE